MMNRNNAAVHVIIICTSAKTSGDSLTEAAGDRKAVENYMDVMGDLNIAWTSWLNWTLHGGHGWFGSVYYLTNWSMWKRFSSLCYATPESQQISILLKDVFKWTMDSGSFHLVSGSSGHFDLIMNQSKKDGLMLLFFLMGMYRVYHATLPDAVFHTGQNTCSTEYGVSCCHLFFRLKHVCCWSSLSVQTRWVQVISQ